MAKIATADLTKLRRGIPINLLIPYARNAYKRVPGILIDMSVNRVWVLMHPEYNPDGYLMSGNYQVSWFPVSQNDILVEYDEVLANQA